ncbi:endochitinase-like [Anopheles moucheti]|uniref:endochitinase-like n=1 Tax=Anopheles moucheti TaxID=186751 RepID=UPI0022F11781|nr:endochitinase-like [Anopheles moucheti]
MSSRQRQYFCDCRSTRTASFAVSVSTMSAGVVMWIVFILALLVDSSMAQGKKLVCSYDPTKALQIGYQPEYIPLEVCTHVIFQAFDFPRFVGRQMLFSDNDKIAFSKVITSVRQRSNTVRVIASIIGSAQDYTATSGTIVRRKAFVQAAISLLLELDADAIELNWRSPGNSNAGHGNGLDRVTMVSLLQDLRQAVISASKNIRYRNRELWFRGSLHLNVVFEAYNVFDICELVDHVTLDSDTVPSLGEVHAPLYSKPIVSPVYVPWLDTRVIDPMNGLNTTTQRWIDEGCPPRKLLFGIGLHGVRKAYSSSMRSFFGSGFGPAKSTYLEQHELCVTIRQGGWKYAWDQYGAMPYATRALQNGQEEHISYEDLNSLRYKMDMVEAKRFGGIYIEHIHSDDIYGRCGQAYSLTAYLASRVRSIPSDIGFAVEWN